MQKLKFRPSTARGYPAGATHHRARASDEAVALARALRQAGATYRAISEAVQAPIGTVESWTTGRRRTAVPCRVIVQRIDPGREISQAVADARRVLRMAPAKDQP